MLRYKLNFKSVANPKTRFPNFPSNLNFSLLIVSMNKYFKPLRIISMNKYLKPYVILK